MGSKDGIRDLEGRSRYTRAAEREGFTAALEEARVRLDVVAGDVDTRFLLITKGLNRFLDGKIVFGMARTEGEMFGVTLVEEVI